MAKPVKLSSSHKNRCRAAEDIEAENGFVAAGARAQQVHLEEQLASPHVKESASHSQDMIAPSKAVAMQRFFLTNKRRIGKSLVALAAVVVLAMMPAMRLLSTTSAEAVVNARVITLRAPIAGVVDPAFSKLQVGTPVQQSHAMLSIQNERAERSRVDDLRRSITAIEIDRSAIVARIMNLEAQATELRSRDTAFRAARVEQLQWRIQEIQSNIQVAEAKHLVSTKRFKRQSKLSKRGYSTPAKLDAAVREQQVETHLLAALRARLKAEEVALEAARAGISVQDSFNDRSRSSELESQTLRRIAGLKVDLQERDQRLKSFNAELLLENERFSKLEQARILAPTHGSIWEILTAPGETVQIGQELVRVLDCAGAVVTATVSESDYNSLRLGGEATFKPRGDSTELAGKIIGLSGLAAAPSNLAIRPSALNREPYRVTVSIPEAGGDALGCNVGRSGVVTFATQSSWSLRALGLS